MSDGDTGADAATHGHDADDIGLTGTPPGSRGAAPWERFGTTTQTVAVVNRWVGPSALHDPVDPDEPVAVDNHDTGGSHAEGGLTVADLIAKIGGPVAERPRHHHAAPDPEPSTARQRAARQLRRLRVAEPCGLQLRPARSRCHPPGAVGRRRRRRADHRAAENVGPAPTGAPRRENLMATSITTSPRRNAAAGTARCCLRAVWWWPRSRRGRWP